MSETRTSDAASVDRERAEIEASLRRLVDQLLPKLPPEGELDPEARREVAARLRLAGRHAETLWAILGGTLVALGRGERYAPAARRLGPCPEIAPNLQ